MARAGLLDNSCARTALAGGPSRTAEGPTPRHVCDLLPAPSGRRSSRGETGHFTAGSVLRRRSCLAPPPPSPGHRHRDKFRPPSPPQPPRGHSAEQRDNNRLPSPAACWRGAGCGGRLSIAMCMPADRTVVPLDEAAPEYRKFLCNNDNAIYPAALRTDDRLCAATRRSQCMLHRINILRSLTWSHCLFERRTIQAITKPPLVSSIRRTDRRSPMGRASNMYKSPCARGVRGNPRAPPARRPRVNMERKQ